MKHGRYYMKNKMLNNRVRLCDFPYNTNGLKEWKYKHYIIHIYYWKNPHRFLWYVYNMKTDQLMLESELPVDVLLKFKALKLLYEKQNVR